MNSTRLQASGVNAGVSTGLPCIAYTAAGNICGRPASIFDTQRGGMVCLVHKPRRDYDTTRAFLAQVEELLREASKHAQRERPAFQPDRSVEILALAVKTRLLRCLLEGGGQ